MDYYVYAYLYEDGEPFYIGKGKGERINWRWARPFEIPPPERRVFLYEGLTERDALDREEALIALYGKENLLNKTTGGQGVSGLRFTKSEECKRMMSERFTGDNNPFYGQTHTEETREKMRESARNRANTSFAEKQRVVQAKKSYRFTNPDGCVIIINGSLNAFCKENGLNTGAMCQLAQGKVNQHKGWRKG